MGDGGGGLTADGSTQPWQPSTVLPDGLVDRFDLLLLAVVGSVAFTMGAPDAGWGLLAALGLQAGVMLAALRIAVAPRRVRRVGLVAGVAVMLVSIVVEVAPPSGLGRGRVLSVLGTVLVLAAMVAIVARLARRRAGVDGTTVFGAVCLYLLLGTLFTFAFGAVAGSGAFFAGDEPTTLATLQYFSFVTLTTVGYGDLAPLTRVGRSLAVVEALIGQVYLVTVVALLVGRLGTGPRGDDAGGAPSDG